jgi:hypothetical protein
MFPKGQIVEQILFPKRQIFEHLVQICSNKSQPIGLLFLVTILPLGVYLG